MNDLFGSRPLAARSWILPIVLSLVIFLAVEVLKASSAVAEPFERIHRRALKGSHRLNRRRPASCPRAWQETPPRGTHERGPHDPHHRRYPAPSASAPPLAGRRRGPRARRLRAPPTTVRRRGHGPRRGPDRPSSYADGTYTAEGSYATPESVETIWSRSRSRTTSSPTSRCRATRRARESEEYQGKFIGGISDEVVGQDIDEISVSRVAGSSLTSGGFNKAIEAHQVRRRGLTP